PTSSIAWPAWSARRTVSAIASPGTALPYSAATAATAAKTEGLANGRAPSWIAMTSWPASASSPAQLDAVRVAPPATTRARVPAMRASIATPSAGATTTMAAYAADASAAAMHHSRTGCPPSSKLTLSVPARVEPPAARIARPALTARSVADGPGPPRLGDLATWLGEDHPPADGLEDPHHGDGDLVADRPGAVLDDDHRPVLEVADALTRFLALLDDPHVDLLAGQHDRADGLREVIHVEHGDPVQL